MTVAELDARLGNGEYERWKVHLARRAQRQEHEANKAKAKAKGGRR